MTNNDRTIITQKSDKLTVISDEITTRNSREDRTYQIITTCSGLTNQLTTTTVMYIEYARTIRDNMKIRVTVKKGKDQEFCSY